MLKRRLSEMFCVFFIFQSLSADSEATFLTEQASLLDHVYTKWYSGPLHHVLTQYKWPSTCAGIFANSSFSSYFIANFIKKYSIDINEFLEPVESFHTFNDFFTRKLKTTARPITGDENQVASPTDGTALVIHNLNSKTIFPIKGVPFSVEQLCASSSLANDFNGGTAFIIRIAPWDYHRLHFPLKGTPSAPLRISGTYESVHPLVNKCNIQPLSKNERHLILHKSDSFDVTAILPVGALFVGSIKETYVPHKEVNKGDELGYFEFGGSTIVILFKKNMIAPSERIVKNSAQGVETKIKMGEVIASKMICDSIQ